MELYLKSNESVLKTSKDLGVSDVTLSKWVMDYKEKHNLLTPSKETLKECAILKMERDILKKATAYFAKQTL